MEVSALSLLAIATGLLAVTAVVWMYYFFQRRIDQMIDHQVGLEGRLAENHQTLSELQNQIAEMQTRSMVQGKHMRELAEHGEQLENQLREVKTQDPSMRLYSRAAELVKEGADVEEVMQACDLPRAEAELLMSMHSRRE